MPADTPPLLADTALIHAFGTAQARCAAGLDAATATLNSVVPPALGPVGARFAAAFTAAVIDHSAAVAALGATAQAAAALAHRNAQGYVAAELRAGQLLPRV